MPHAADCQSAIQQAASLRYQSVHMKIIRAEHLGMCFGVKDAIALASETAKQEPLTILGDLVHNETVLAELRAQGIRLAQQPAERGHANGNGHGPRRFGTRDELNRADAV